MSNVKRQFISSHPNENRVKTEQIMQFSPVSMVSLLQTEALVNYLPCHPTICEIWTRIKKHSGLWVTDVDSDLRKWRGEWLWRAGRSAWGWGPRTDCAAWSLIGQGSKLLSPLGPDTTISPSARWVDNDYMGVWLSGLKLIIRGAPGCGSVS